MKILLANQKACIINGGKTIFKSKKGTRQGDPTLAYLSILVLEDVFAMAKSNIFIYSI